MTTEQIAHQTFLDMRQLIHDATDRATLDHLSDEMKYGQFTIERMIVLDNQIACKRAVLTAEN